MKTKTKRCPVCERLLPASCFHKRTRNGKEGLNWRCKNCACEYVRAHYRKNSAELLAKQRARREADPTPSRLTQKKSKLKAKYDITPEQHESMMKSQGGKCASCLRLRPLVVDHCHKTGRVRALLCRHCNCALGFVEDNYVIALRLAKYAKTHC